MLYKHCYTSDVRKKDVAKEILPDKQRKPFYDITNRADWQKNDFVKWLEDNGATDEEIRRTSR
jgi:hypothetical protein